MHSADSTSDWKIARKNCTPWREKWATTAQTCNPTQTEVEAIAYSFFPDCPKKLTVSQCAVCHPAPYYSDNLKHNLRVERFFEEKIVLVTKLTGGKGGPGRVPALSVASDL